MPEQGAAASAVTTHVLDTARGVPAAGVPVRLEQAGQRGAAPIAEASTDAGGRVTALGPARLPAGLYQLVFDTGGYLARQSAAEFFPEVSVTFRIDDETAHYHVPLLLSPFGYCVYRGS